MPLTTLQGRLSDARSLISLQRRMFGGTYSCGLRPWVTRIFFGAWKFERIRKIMLAGACAIRRVLRPRLPDGSVIRPI